MTKRPTREEQGLFHIPTPHDPTTFHLLNASPDTEQELGRRADGRDGHTPVPAIILVPAPERKPKHPYRGSRASLLRRNFNKPTDPSHLTDPSRKVAAFGSYNAESRAWKPTSDVTSKSFSDFELASRAFDRENTTAIGRRHPADAFTQTRQNTFAHDLRMRREQTVPLISNKKQPTLLSAKRIEPNILSRQTHPPPSSKQHDRLTRSCDNKPRGATSPVLRRRGREATWLAQTQPRGVSTQPPRCFPIADSFGNPPPPKFSNFSLQVRREAKQEILTKAGISRFPRYSSLRSTAYI